MYFSAGRMSVDLMNFSRNGSQRFGRRYMRLALDLMSASLALSASPQVIRPPRISQLGFAPYSNNIRNTNRLEMKRLVAISSLTFAAWFPGQSYRRSAQ